MADRFFPNTMRSFIDEATVNQSLVEGEKDVLSELVYLPYGALCEKLKRVALNLKQTVLTFL